MFNSSYLNDILSVTPQTLFELHYKNSAINHLQEDTDFKIPLISHHIWLTSIKAPQEVANSDLKNLNNTIFILDKSSNSTWQHIFWTNCNSCIPQTIQQLKSFNIEIRNIDGIKEQLIFYDTISMFVDEQYYMGCHLLRYDLMRIFGGFYSDLNYVMSTSPESIMKKLDFFAASDPYTLIGLESHMFASSINHPILKATLNFVSERIKNSCLGLETSQCNDHSYLSLSYGPLSIGFLQSANKHGTVDLAIPPRELKKIPDFQYSSIIYHLDGSTTASYVYRTCSLDPTDEMNKSFQEYFENHVICIDIFLGKDGVTLFDDSYLDTSS